MQPRRPPTSPFLLPLSLCILAGAVLGQDEVVEIKDSAGRLRATVKETIIGFNDPAMNEESFVSSPDGKRVAYIVMAGDGLAVVVDGVKGELFEGVAYESLTFSRDGRHFGYVGTRPGKQCAVLDGQVHEYRGVSKQGIVFSPDGKRSAWVALREGNYLAAVDGVESAPYDAITAQGVMFSPDGARCAFVATSGGKHVVVLDGEEGPLFDSVAGFQFTPHGKHALYVALRDGKRFAVVDTTTFGPYDDIRALASSEGAENPLANVFEVSADGSRVGFLAARGEEWFVVVDGKETGPFQKCVSLAISPDGSRVAYLATRGEGWVMVIDGKEQPGNGLQSLSFSPDGKRKAVIQKRGDKFIARIDGVDGKEVDGTEYDRIEEPGVHFSHDGLHTAYLAQARGEKFVVVDGVEGQHFKRLGTTALAFVPNGSRVMYAVRRGEKRESLVIGDAEGPVVEVDEEHSVPYRALTFSPDGSRYAYAAHLEKDKEIAVIDGELFGPGGKQAPDKLRTYTKLAKRTPFFSPDGRRVGFVAEREDGWVAVVDGVESPLYSIVQRTAMDFSPDGQHIAFVAGRQGKKMIVVDGFELDHGWDGFLPKSDIVWDGSKRFSIRASRNPKYMLVEVELP